MGSRNIIEGYLIPLFFDIDEATENHIFSFFIFVSMAENII